MDERLDKPIDKLTQQIGILADKIKGTQSVIPADGGSTFKKEEPAILTPNEKSRERQKAIEFGKALGIGIHAPKGKLEDLTPSAISPTIAATSASQKQKEETKKGGGLFSSILGSLGTVGTIIGVVGLLAILKDSIVPIIQIVTDFFSNVLANLPAIIKGLGATVPPILDSLFTGFSKLQPIISNVIDAFKFSLTSVLDKLPIIITQIEELIPPIINALFTGFNQIGALLPPIIYTVFEGISKLEPIITGLLDAFKFVFISVLDKLPTIIKEIGAIIPPIIESILIGLNNAAPGIAIIIEAVKLLFTSVLEKLPPLIKEIGAIIPPIIDSILTGLSNTAPGIAIIIDAVKLLFTEVLEKLQPVLDTLLKGVKEFAELVLPYIKSTLELIVPIVNSVSSGISLLITSLGSGISSVLDSMSNIIKTSGDTIVNIANSVSDSISRFFGNLADTILRLNGVDTAKLKEIGPALASIGSGLAQFGSGGLIQSALSGLGSLFGADSPFKQFEKLGEIAPKIQSIPKSLEELSKYKDLELLKDLNLDKQTISINNLNAAAWNLKGTLEKMKNIKLPDLGDIKNQNANTATDSANNELVISTKNILVESRNQVNLLQRISDNTYNANLLLQNLNNRSVNPSSQSISINQQANTNNLTKFNRSEFDIETSPMYNMSNSTTK